MAPYAGAGSRLLDIGCADGVLFRSLDEKLSAGVGIDLDPVPPSTPKYRYVQGPFPSAVPAGERFDVVAALAVVEHIPEPEQRAFAVACFGLMRDGGCLVLTIPSPRVDGLLHALKAIRVLDGMADHQHFGFKPERAIGTFRDAGFALERRSTFQLGLNNLFIFRKPSQGASPS